ncbi:hypothetical protein BD289DRAFT_34871 [Coniella lustricola]|uniref:Secreted protein n=1 Tax=Coniella lustricola TaxID=2025994 RepID=A0A2T3A2H0_9PEZI|nr:hypothetical protein BD289DRAFT_34871 [Coniella lustricola]
MSEQHATLGFAHNACILVCALYLCLVSGTAPPHAWISSNQPGWGLSAVFLDWSGSNQFRWQIPAGDPAVPLRPKTGPEHALEQQGSAGSEVLPGSIYRTPLETTNK